MWRTRAQKNISSRGRWPDAKSSTRLVEAAVPNLLSTKTPFLHRPLEPSRQCFLAIKKSKPSWACTHVRVPFRCTYKRCNIESSRAGRNKHPHLGVCRTRPSLASAWNWGCCVLTRPALPCSSFVLRQWSEVARPRGTKHHPTFVVRGRCSGDHSKPWARLLGRSAANM